MSLGSTSFRKNVAVFCCTPFTIKRLQETAILLCPNRFLCGISVSDKCLVAFVFVTAEMFCRISIVHCSHGIKKELRAKNTRYRPLIAAGLSSLLLWRPAFCSPENVLLVLPGDGAYTVCKPAVSRVNRPSSKASTNFIATRPRAHAVGDCVRLDGGGRTALRYIFSEPL